MTSVTAQSHAWMMVAMVQGWQSVSSFLFALSVNPNLTLNTDQLNLKLDHKP